MSLDELLEMLEIEDAEEFQYFENFADLMECEEEYPSDTLYELVSRVDIKVFGELIENYFDEIMESIPEDCIDLYTLLNTIKMSLMGMAGHLDEERDYVLFTDELYKFRCWYAFESEVVCKNKESDKETVNNLRDALILSRLEKLNQEEYYYDFDECLKYELEEYVVSFADIIAAEIEQEKKNPVHEFYGDEDECDCGDEHHELHNHHHHHTMEALEDGFVYDDEFRDDY